MLDLLDNPTLAQLAQPERLADGCTPEQRLVAGGIGWEGYLAFDEALGHDRPGSRLFYLDGDLEIMSTSEEHERINRRIATCLDLYFHEQEIEDFAHGEATMRLTKEAGAEPDGSWCFEVNKDFPDLVLEITLTSGGLPKSEIYRRFAVPEVWIWRRGRLEIYCLRADESGYDPSGTSQLLADLPISALEAAVRESSSKRARHDFLAALGRSS